jgi:hypothetical protein
LNVVLVAPAATVVVAGTVATAVLLLERDTEIPPLGAAAVKLTVPVVDEPPTTVVGFTATELSVGVDCGGDTDVLLPDPPHEFNVISTANNPTLDMNAGRNLVFQQNLIETTPRPSQIA